MEPVSIELDDVSVDYTIYGQASRSFKKSITHLLSSKRLSRDASDEQTRVKALKHINLSIKENQRIGLIGSNGSGKTTMLRVMSGVLKPAAGNFRRVGITAPLFDVSLGMNLEATGYDNITLRSLYLGLTPDEVRDKLDDIINFCDLTHDQLMRPVRTYSSGMMMKLAFAISTSIDPEILLLDEWIGVGDAHFFEKAQSRMSELVGRARILVVASHVDKIIQSLCNKVLYLREGEIAGFGPVDDMLALYHSHQ